MTRGAHTEKTKILAFPMDHPEINSHGWNSSAYPKLARALSLSDHLPTVRALEINGMVQ